MIAYEFYGCDPLISYQLIGLLPERRKYLKRITHESIMNWGKTIFGENIDRSEIFFVKVKINDNTSELIRANIIY